MCKIPQMLLWSSQKQVHELNNEDLIPDNMKIWAENMFADPLLSFLPVSESSSNVRLVMFELCTVLCFPGWDRISWTQRRRRSRGAEGSLRSPRGCWSYWTIWWEGKLLRSSLQTWRPKTIRCTVSCANSTSLFCTVSHVWSGMIAQRGLTRKIVFPILPLGIASDYLFISFTSLLLLSKRGSFTQLVFFIVKLAVRAFAINALKYFSLLWREKSSNGLLLKA